ncbi:unnamed protein product [Peronospora farinosa]|uniref:Uncharacterized protein n=1 Tax=Peronospora farinosa TaxID=134698 RepID=A0AAV0SXH4_9STRA|nr:unnamed protein product [Peronospora farinosa]CAI5708376.1 unnamed protein product [Peronospora farinosa]
MFRDRTVWFLQHDIPAALMPGGQPLREIGFESPVRAPANAVSTPSGAQAAAAASPPVRTLTEGILIIYSLAPTASVQAWMKVTRHALCSRAPNISVAAEFDASNSPVKDGRLVFGFPVTPTSFELAFSEKISMNTLLATPIQSLLQPKCRSDARHVPYLRRWAAWWPPA